MSVSQSALHDYAHGANKSATSGPNGNHGRVVAMSVHQPSQSSFGLFDKVSGPDGLANSRNRAAGQAGRIMGANMDPQKGLGPVRIANQRMDNSGRTQVFLMGKGHLVWCGQPDQASCFLETNWELSLIGGDGVERPVREDGVERAVPEALLKVVSESKSLHKLIERSKASFRTYQTSGFSLQGVQVRLS